MIVIECGISFDAYSCWRKMLIEDCFCSTPWRMCTSSKSELSEREQTKKIIVVKASVSKEIFQEKINYFFIQIFYFFFLLNHKQSLIAAALMDTTKEIQFIQ